MKIGILTFHKAINYGAFLQSFALSNELTNRFPEHNVEIVDYIAPMEKKKIVINVLWGIKHYGLINGVRELQKISSFNRIYKKLNLSKKKRFKNLQELHEYIDNNYDVLIIGSDAVFNWNQNGYPSAFVPKYNFKQCKVLSYAASVHGLRYLNEPLERLEECGQVFSKMKLVGVRDMNTEKFVKRCYTEANISHCCDPTVVIDVDKVKQYAKNYMNRVYSKYKCDLSKKFIVLMLPDSDFTRKIKEHYSGKFQIITLFKPSKDAQYYLYDLNPFEWTMVLSNASVVITSYFHGTLLALRQGTPVISIDLSNYNDKDYEGKLKDLLQKRLNLPEFYVNGDDMNNDEFQKKLISIINSAIQGHYSERIRIGMKCEGAAFEKFCNTFSAIIKE